MIKRTLVSVAGSRMFARFVSLLERIDRGGEGWLAVLTYHRVDEPDHRPWLSPALLSATPDAFAAQMSFLANHRQVVSVAEVLAALDGEQALPPRAVLITFDDAYCDFAEQAWPVLKALGLPVTLFVPTAFPDHPERRFWWDRLFQATHDPERLALDTPSGRLALGSAEQRRRLFKQLRESVKRLEHDAAMAWIEAVCGESRSVEREPAVMSWDALRQLAGEGVTLGAHTQTHPLLNRITLERAEAEAVGSLRDLRREIGDDVLPIFAYPSGGANRQVADVLRRNGFRLAFTTERGLNDWRQADPLLLRRINVGSRTPLAALRLQMLPLTARLRQ